VLAGERDDGYGVYGRAAVIPNCCDPIRHPDRDLALHELVPRLERRLGEPLQTVRRERPSWRERMAERRLVLTLADWASVIHHDEAHERIVC
jgi:hypothetical protein